MKVNHSSFQPGKKAIRTKDFDAESTNMSRMQTIKTFVAEEHHGNQELMQMVQYNVAITLPQNPLSPHIIMPIQNNVGDVRYFGKVFCTIEGIELPYLQYVKNTSLVKAPTTLEIGAGMGSVSWKVPLTFGNKGGMHYGNELSRTMMDKFFDPVIQNRLQNTPLKGFIAKLPGDCFTILTQKPELKGKCDAIFTQNVEHFFNPVTHQRFLSLLEELLTEGGQAFLCAHSFHFGHDLNDPLRKFYIEQKASGVMYPGFMKFDVDSVEFSRGNLESTFSNPQRPADDAEFVKYDLVAPRKERVLLDDFEVEATFLKQRITENLFSPAIYKAAVNPHPFLEVVESFYIENTGERSEEVLWNSSIAHAGLIVRKLNETVVLVKAITSNDTAKLATVLATDIDINKAAETGVPPIHYALGYENQNVNPSVIKSIVTKGADVNQRAVQTGDTPMHLAASSVSIGAMNLLLAKNAEVDAVNAKQQTPLHALIEKHGINLEQKIAAIKYLLYKSASVAKQDSEGHDAIYLAQHHCPEASDILEHPGDLLPYAEFEATIAGSIAEYNV